MSSIAPLWGWTHRAPGVAIFATVAVLLAGCGSSSASPTATAAPTSTPKPTATTASAAAPTTAPAESAHGTPATKTKTVVVVVTATPKLPKGSRFTPVPTKGVATPLPKSTAVPPVAGLRLGMITRPLHTVTTVQTQVDARNKKYLFYLRPTAVVRKTLPQYGFRPPIQIASPAKPVRTYSGRPVQKADVKYRGTLYAVYVAQTGRQGKGGIWQIVTILRQHLRLGEITRPLNVVRRLQTQANTGKKNYAFYRNPYEVVKRGLPQYGFTPPFQIVQKPQPVASASGRPVERAEVKYYGDLYYVDVAQPGVHGARGIWVIVTILRLT